MRRLGSQDTRGIRLQVVVVVVFNDSFFQFVDLNTHAGMNGTRVVASGGFEIGQAPKSMRKQQGTTT